MANPIGNGVTLRGFQFEDAQFTCLISGSVSASDVGKAVAQDTTAANTVKLAGDGDVIVGRLMSYENRVQEGLVVGTVAFQFLDTLPIKSGLSGGAAVVRGKFLIGAGSGEVKAIDTAASGFVWPFGAKACRVWELPDSATAVASLI